MADKKPPKRASDTEWTVLPDGGSEIAPDKISEIAETAATDPDSVTDEVGTFTDALDHPNSSVREDAIDALNAIARHDPAAVTPAVSALISCVDDDPTSATAGDTLNVISKDRPGAFEPVIEDVFHRLLDSGVPLNIGRAAKIFRRVSEESPDACNTVVQQLYDTVSDPNASPNARRDAAERLGVISLEGIDPLDTVLPELLSYLSDDDPEIRRAILQVAAGVEADGQYADVLKNHEQPLRSLLNHDDELVRERAYEALSAAGIDAEPPAEIADNGRNE